MYTNDRYPSATEFTSIMTLDLKKLIDPQLVHVFYGMAKDYAAAGARLGMIYSRNSDLRNSLISTKCVVLRDLRTDTNSFLSSFSRPPYLMQEVWAGILEDKAFLKDYWKLYSDRLTSSFNSMRDWLEARQATYYKGT